MTTSGGTRPPSPRDILGVPFLPPNVVTAASNRVRWTLGGVHAGMAPPPVRILEGLFGILDHRVLVALCEAGVPEALVGRTTPAELAQRLGADPVRLERLLRYGASRGWVRIDRKGRVRPSRVTAFLRSDHPSGWRGWVDFAGGDDVVKAIGTLSARATPSDGFSHANGKPFFEWMSEHPERGAAFDRAMAAGGRMHALMIDQALDWGEARQVCDVGGGTGDLLRTLLDLNPHLRGTLLDLAPVVERAPRHDRMEIVAGDAFSAVPAGCDVYLLVNVLHDWNDTDAVRILRSVRDAADDRARILVLDNAPRAVPRPDMAIAADVLMAALTNGGQERDRAAFAVLGRQCQLNLIRTIPLASSDVVHEFRRTT